MMPEGLHYTKTKAARQHDLLSTITTLRPEREVKAEGSAALPSFRLPAELSDPSIRYWLSTSIVMMVEEGDHGIRHVTI